jgi:hypothetical protein
MTSRAARFKQSDLTRALRAAVAAGMKPSGYRIDASGEIHVTLGDGLPKGTANPWDEVLQ